MAEHQYVLLVGNPFDGVEPVGPFPSRESAWSWGEQNHSETEWWVRVLISPLQVVRKVANGSK